MSKLIIAKPGYDINASEENLIFNSKNVYKLAFKGNLSVSVTYIDNGFGEAVGIAENSFHHNLGYVPIGFAFSTDFGMQIPAFFRAGAGVAVSFSYRIDNDKFYISINDNAYFGQIGDTIVFNFKYQIMYDKII